MILLIIIAALVISFYFMGHSDWHLERNKHNKPPSGKLTKTKDEGDFYKDEKEMIWELQPAIKNKFHQPGHTIERPDLLYPNIEPTPEFDPKNSNLKFLCALKNGGSYEAIVQPDGTILNTGLKQGTYNYGHPSGLVGSIKHLVMDVIPHFVNSNYQQID